MPRNEEGSAAVREVLEAWNLPDPSPFTPRPASISTEALCHGCGKSFEMTGMKRCSKCKRVFYCSKDCQKLDWISPRNHKFMCQEDLLALAMDNIHRLPVNEKMRLISQGKQSMIPNNQFCQTVAKVSCPGLAAFIENAYKELKLLRENFLDASEEVCYNYPGNILTTYVEENRYGLDVGVEALVAAINLWPNVYTVNSCSGVHKDAWVPIVGGGCFCEDFVKFVSDDRNALNQVSSILEAGAVGIRFSVSEMNEQKGFEDKIASIQGFLVVDYDAGNGPQMCRTNLRTMSFAKQPFDKLDSMLWVMASPDTPPIARTQANLIGLLATAIELVKANLTLVPSDYQRKQLNELMKCAELERKRTIFNRTKTLSMIGIEPATELLEKFEKDNWWT